MKKLLIFATLITLAGLALAQDATKVVKAEEVIDYTPKENVAEKLAKRFGASIGEGAVRALRSLAPIR